MTQIRMPVIPFWGQRRATSRLGNPALMTNEFTLQDAVIPRDIKNGLLLGVGGAAVVGLAEVLPDADMIPEEMKPVGIVGGLLVAGFGAYKLYDYFFGDQKRKTIQIPPQKVSSLDMVLGRILEPQAGGQAELSNMWPALVGVDSRRRFKVVFQITNNSPDDLIVPVEFYVSEKKTILSNAITRATYVVKVAKGGTSEIVSEWQPISATLLGGISAEAKLVLKGQSSLQDRELEGSVKFSI